MTRDDKADAFDELFNNFFDRIEKDKSFRQQLLEYIRQHHREEAIEFMQNHYPNKGEPKQ